ncbi:MAG TPA: ATP-binding cassette domain-containing protein [Xanthobacteraceae bacterium]|nr:ATP-binding cassette domain-containing protein [Xanthobacteraceae bacterium]
MATDPLIQVRDVSKSYDGGRSFAVRNATLSVAEKVFVSLVGSSGSGKSTLLKFINRLVQQDSGSIIVGGKDTLTGDVLNLRRSIGYVFQNAALFPHMSVAENIGITPDLLGWPAARTASRVAELLDLVELPRTYGSRYPATLSGGERQRAAVARAIAAYPKIVLMDEPFGALDPLTRDVVGSTYRKLHDQFGFTTMMVTHDVQEAILLADQIAVMNSGRILAHDTPQRLSENTIPEVVALMTAPRRQAERIRAATDLRNGHNAHE